ncbi:MAG: sigma-70 family RNA polymerase sigma factor, partial [Chloroflexota bacterium]
MVETMANDLNPWQRFAASRDAALREQLLLQYVPLVSYVVGRVCACTPRGMERGDLISVGTLGLLDAVDKFEPERGTKFEAYAIARIRGAVIDHLRSQGTISRTALRKSRALDNAMSTLHAELGRAPSDPELSRHLGVNVAELRDYLAETVPV